MPAVRKAFRRYTLHEYIDQVLKPAVGKVRFPELHIHGTDKPTIAMFRKRPGEWYIQAMYRFHTLTNGWSDIAQHATIDPDGYIWEGRSLLLPPASASGYNDPDADRVHPFMYEILGQFDRGRERLEGAQLHTTIGLSHAVMKLFGSAPVFHRERTSRKTCPGSGIDKSWLVSLIAAYGRVQEKKQAPKPSPATPEPIRIIVNGKQVNWGCLIEGETWVPARAVGVALGVVIGWNGNVTASDKELPTRLIGGLGYVRVRDLAVAAGAEIGWDAKTKTVMLSK